MKVNKGTVFAVMGVIGTGVTAGLSARAVLKAEQVLVSRNDAVIVEENGSRTIVLDGKKLTKKEVAQQIIRDLEEDTAAANL